jgi:PAS domain S-box-containing protein
MNTFFSEQGDFILAVQGIAFIALAVACLLMGPGSRPALPWRWFGLFALLTGLERWLELLTPALYERETFIISLWLLRLAALLALLEFGRRGWPWPLSRILLFGMVALLAIALAFWGGWALVKSGTLWLLMLIAGLAAVGTLRRHALPGAGIGGAAWMTLGGGQLWLFLLTAYVLTPPALPWQSFRETPDDVVLRSVQQWLPLLLGPGAITLIFLLLQTQGVQRRRPYLLWSLPLHLAVLLAGWGFTNFATQMEAEDNRTNLLLRAKTAAAALDPELVAKLEGAPADTIRPEYASVRKLLHAVRHSNADTRFVYLFAAHGSRVVFLADSEPENSKAYSPPGQAYEEASLEVRRALRIHHTFLEGPLQDRWGLWISGFAPVVRAAGGAPVALLGMDVAVSSWQTNLYFHRLATLGLMLFVGLLLLALFAGLHMARESAREIAATENRFRALFESAPEAVLVVDVDTGRILDTNPFVCRWLGYTAEELRGHTIFELAVKDTEITRQNLAAAYAATAPTTVESAYRCKDGRVVAVEITQPAFQVQTRKAVLAYVRDVTERRENEEQLRKSMTELERFNRLMVGREVRVIELKKEVNDLRRALGQPPIYTSVEQGGGKKEMAS